MSVPPPIPPQILPEKSSTGLDVNLAAALSYVGFFIVSGILFLIIEKDSRFVRFHAMQATLTGVAFMIIYVVLGVIPILGWILSFFVWLGSIVLWLVLMFKAYQGERFKLPVVGDIAEQQVNRV